MKVTKTERKLIAALAELQHECSARKAHAKKMNMVIEVASKSIEELCDANEKLHQRIKELTADQTKVKEVIKEAITPTTKPTTLSKGIKKDGTPKRKPGPPKKTATVEPVQPELPLVDGVDVSPGAQPDFLKGNPNGEDQ